MGLHEESKPGARRRPSRLAQQLSDAFAPCAAWSEVRLERRPGGRRVRVILGEPGVAGSAAPFDWASGQL